jgi:hypothetical protein
MGFEELRAPLALTCVCVNSILKDRDNKKQHTAFLGKVWNWRVIVSN